MTGVQTCALPIYGDLLAIVMIESEEGLGNVDAIASTPGVGAIFLGAGNDLTHSLGVGAGVWIPGLDAQLNNLLGESDIAHGDPQAGDHLESRMAPSLAFDDHGLALAIGAAGATRLRTALVTVLAAILDEGLDPETAVSIPRVHATLDVVDTEPGVSEAALSELESRGRTVRRWDRFHHYFGGVSCIGRAGAAGDPRRSGAAILL